MQNWLDFSISFMRSQTGYHHRFIRFKNVDSERQVLLENAVERYLVELECDKGATSSQRNFSVVETVIYSTFQEDSAVPQPEEGKKSLTLLMLVERKQCQLTMPAANLLHSNINGMAERGDYLYCEKGLREELAKCWQQLQARCARLDAANHCLNSRRASACTL